MAYVVFPIVEISYDLGRSDFLMDFLMGFLRGFLIDVLVDSLMDCLIDFPMNIWSS